MENIEMKIKVIPEGRDNIWLIEPDEIIKYIKKYSGKKIHNFISCTFGVIGADWNKKDVIEKIINSDKIAILTEEAREHNFNHALSVICGNELYLFDIGNITKENLEIIVE